MQLELIPELGEKFISHRLKHGTKICRTFRQSGAARGITYRQNDSNNNTVDSNGLAENNGDKVL
jgi:hypothetical protein